MKAGVIEGEFVDFQVFDNGWVTIIFSEKAIAMRVAALLELERTSAPRSVEPSGLFAEAIGRIEPLALSPSSYVSP